MDTFRTKQSPLYWVLLKSYADISDKRAKSQKEGTFENILAHTFFTALAVRNECGITQLLKCCDLVRKNKDIYQHEVKKYLRATEREKNKYCSLTGTFAYTEELIDHLDEISAMFGERIKNSYNTMLQTISKEMSDKGVRNVELFSQIEMCCIYLDTTLEIFDSECRSEAGMGNVFRDFRYMKLEDLCKCWHKTCGYIYEKNFPWTVNLNSKKCKVAYKGLVNAMRDYKYILSLITNHDERADRDQYTDRVQVCSREGL